MKDLFEEFADYAKKQFGYDISLWKSCIPDTYESLFKYGSFVDGYEDVFLGEEFERTGSYTNTNIVVSGYETGSNEKFDSDQEITFAA